MKSPAPPYRGCDATAPWRGRKGQGTPWTCVVASLRFAAHGTPPHTWPRFGLAMPPDSQDKNRMVSPDSRTFPLLKAVLQVPRAVEISVAESDLPRTRACAGDHGISRRKSFARNANHVEHFFAVRLERDSLHH